ncbi:MAG: right-handed parallel beta-helix repeat-containing protein, partial [Planctomycetota bacterium]
MVRLGEFHMTPLLVRVAAFLAAQFTGATSAQVVFVDWQAAPGGDGSSWSDAFDSLDDALDAAGSGDELWVRRGTYQPGSLFGRDSTFEIPGGVAVFGGFEGGETSRAQRDPQDNQTTLTGGGNLYSVVTIEQDGVTLDGFTITGGRADGFGTRDSSGAGVFVDSAAPTLRNLIIAGCEGVSNGAGIALNGVASSAAIVEDCTFTDITGAFAFSASLPTLMDDCLFQDNDAGAMQLTGSDTHIVTDTDIRNNSGLIGTVSVQMSTQSGETVFDRCEFASNDAVFAGGIRYNGLGTHEVRNSVFRGNGTSVGTGSGGAAIAMTSSNASVAFENCLFTGNTHSGQGAAIRMDGDGTLFVIGCTITGNSTTGPVGAGISVLDGSANLFNTIVFGNAGGSGLTNERVSVFVATGLDADADRCIIEFLGLGATSDLTATN